MYTFSSSWKSSWRKCFNSCLPYTAGEKIATAFHHKSDTVWPNYQRDRYRLATQQRGKVQFEIQIRNFKSYRHGLINYIDTKAKCRHLKQFSCKCSSVWGITFKLSYSIVLRRYQWESETIIYSRLNFIFC